MITYDEIMMNFDDKIMMYVLWIICNLILNSVMAMLWVGQSSSAIDPLKEVPNNFRPFELYTRDEMTPVTGYVLWNKPVITV